MKKQLFKNTAAIVLYVIMLAVVLVFLAGNLLA